MNGDKVEIYKQFSKIYKLKIWIRQKLAMIIRSIHKIKERIKLN